MMCVMLQVDDGPCVMYIGDGGAGNYVKMVHNGIEYGDMQLISGDTSALVYMHCFLMYCNRPSMHSCWFCLGAACQVQLISGTCGHSAVAQHSMC